MEPLVSVVIPVLNNRHGFVSAFDSLNGDECSIEIIVIDGGSTDGTVDEIIQRERNIAYWETGKDNGIADAFNRGISVAKGEFTVILNSDDFWEPDVMEHLKSAIKENPDADVFYGALRFIDNEKNYRYVRFPDISKMQYRMSLFHPAMIVRKSCYQEIGFYDDKYTHAMDSEWCHRAIKKGKVFCEIPFVLANMSLGGVSDRDYHISLSQYRDSLIKNRLSNRYMSYLFYYLNLVQKKAIRLPFFYPLKLVKDRFFHKN
ncbi:MAG: glycosyltransferase [Gammaproteobacteria bacterium]|nr:glycosyltransferase [Gammaproteobacteria bacterium]